MDYQTFEPNPLINSFVKCYWTLHAPKEANPEKQRIVPDGCMEMIFHHGDLYKQYTEDGGYLLQPRCFVFGQITKTLEIQPRGVTAIFAVRFQPDGFVPFANIPLKQLENNAVSLSKLFGDEGLDLEHKIIAALTTQDRIAIIESFLMNRLMASETIDRMITSSVKTILDLKGQLSVMEIADAVDINRRYLERRFSTVIGLSPKQLAKIVRLQSTIHTMLSKNVDNLTVLAYESNYFDQAHFIKDFKEFTGVSPKKFYSNHLKMSNLFSK